MYDNNNMPYLDGSMDEPWNSPRMLPEEPSMALTPKEQEQLSKKIEAMKREIIANRIPKTAQNDIDKVLSIINIPEFTERKWDVGSGEFRFSTAISKDVGVDTDGDTCYIIVDFTLDLPFETVSLSMRLGSHGSNGFMADLLLSMDTEPPCEILLKHIEPLAILSKKANEFIEARRELDTSYVSGDIIDHLDAQLKDILTSIEK